MRRLRVWLACKLVPDVPIKNIILSSALTTAWETTSSTAAIWYPKGDRLYRYYNGVITEEDDMGKKKKRSKAAGKAAAKNKQENRQKAKGGKGAR